MALQTYHWALNYTVEDDYFTGSTEKSEDSVLGSPYGLSEWLFHQTPDDSLNGAAFSFTSAFRFIGDNENGGARWSVGDTIDMFYLDFENEEVEQNNGFELGGATTLSLTAAGIALFSAVMM